MFALDTSRQPIAHVSNWNTYDASYTIGRTGRGYAITFFAPDDNAARAYADRAAADFATEAGNPLRNEVITRRA